MDWSWAVEGVTEETPRTTGPECINYMTNRRRWIEAILFTLLFLWIIRWAVKRLQPIVLPPVHEIERPHTAVRLLLLIAMTLIFGIEIGFKLAGKSVIFIMNPCHIQTMVQIYLLASKPSKTTIALFRIQMSNLNGPLLAFLFPEVECRTLPFEQATYWTQHALLYIIPVYILKSGAYKAEDISDYNWVTIGVMIMLVYHFVVLNAFSIWTGINLNHMLCAAVADPFQGQNYRIAAVIHESILCPILNKVTVLLFSGDIRKYDNNKNKSMPLQKRVSNRTNSELQQIQQVMHADKLQTDGIYHQKQLTPTEQLSLAAEMAAAMGKPLDTFRQRQPQQQQQQQQQLQQQEQQQQQRKQSLACDREVEYLLQKETEQAATAIHNNSSIDYSNTTMPTTKID